MIFLPTIGGTTRTYGNNTQTHTQDKENHTHTQTHRTRQEIHCNNLTHTTFVNEPATEPNTQHTTHPVSNQAPRSFSILNLKFHSKGPRESDDTFICEGVNGPEGPTVSSFHFSSMGPLGGYGGLT